MNRQPNSDYCFVCGRKNEHDLRMIFYDDGHHQVFADYTVDEQYQGFPGVVHGGIVAAEATLTLAGLPAPLRPESSLADLGWYVDE